MCIGAKICGSDDIIIRKTIISNNSICYEMTFDFMPRKQETYIWINTYHDEFAKIFELFLNAGSKIVQKNNMWYLIGPSVYSMSNEYIIAEMNEDPNKIEEIREIDEISCDKSPNEILNNELGFSLI